MKRSLLVFVGLMMGMAHAQTVNWDAAFASCSSEAAAFDRHAAENYMYWQNSGSLATWRHMRRDYTGSTIDVPSMRQALQSNRSLLSRGPNPVVALTVCVQQAALNQVQSGSTQSAAAAPSRPSQYNAPASRSGRDRPDLNASRCLERSNNQLRNNCGQKVSVNWCTDDYGTYGCGNNNLGWSVLDPGDSTYLSASKAWWFACAAPARPTEVEYLPGRGLRAACTE